MTLSLIILLMNIIMHITIEVAVDEIVLVNCI